MLRLVSPIRVVLLFLLVLAGCRSGAQASPQYAAASAPLPAPPLPSTADLPLELAPSSGTSPYLAVLLSGDGGWNVTERGLAADLAGKGMFVVVHLGTAVPNAPAIVGAYQFFCVLGLTMFGADKTSAAAFSFIAFFVLTLPLWVLGFVASVRSGLSMTQLRQAS